LEVFHPPTSRRWAAVGVSTARASGEVRIPPIRGRGGELLVPEFARVPAAAVDEAHNPWDQASTVLITGGTSGLGALVARHLVTEHGVRRLQSAHTPPLRPKRVP